MNFRPLHDRVLVRRVEAEEKTAGGIIIPDTAREGQEKALTGTVVALGTGGIDKNGHAIEFVVAVGDTVAFGKWGGSDIKIDGEELKLIKQDEILGIVG